MIETFNGNHHAKNAEREYQHGNPCENCNRDEVEIEISWCPNYDKKCAKPLNSKCLKDCKDMIVKWECRNCGHIQEE